MSKVSGFGRRSGGRKQRRILLVLGDGISEKMYFDQINRMDIDMRVVSVATEETGFDGTFRKATNLIRRNNINIESGDRVAVVMDLDDRYSEKEMAELESRYSREGFEVFLSNPCFEVWLIQHFRTVNRKGDCRAMVGVLEEVFKREGWGITENRMEFLSILTWLRRQLDMQKPSTGVSNAPSCGAMATIQAQWYISS